MLTNWSLSGPDEGWPTIDTAPQDGSTVLAGNLSPWGTFNLHACQARWSEVLGKWVFSYPGDVVDGKPFDPQPTHWSKQLDFGEQPTVHG